MIVANYVVAIFAFGISLGPYPVVAFAKKNAELMESEGRYQDRRHHNTLRGGQVRGERELGPKKGKKKGKKEGKKELNRKKDEKNCMNKKGVDKCNTDSPTSSPSTGSPPTGSPPTGSPPTGSPPTGSPPTSAPPTSSPPTGGGICFMLYQMADNNLESAIRADLSEMTKSALTKSASTTTWVYHDGLNQPSEYFTGGPLEDVYNKDGTALTENFQGSRYLTWDHGLQKMVVNTTLPTELNSDLPSVLQAFVKNALTDCVAKGSSEFFLALSSHGSGFVGFGYDDHKRRRSRKLQQSNPDMYSAIQGALSAVSGAPKILDVLGFDACLMQSMDALDDFANITKYYLASEAIEPGHGWAYNELLATNSSLVLAKNVLDTFLTSMHDGDDHRTPKTMALTDASAYSAFRNAWDALFSAMAEILDSGDDADFHASLVRVRGNTLSFEGFLKSEINVNAAMDIGDFFAELFATCIPDQSSELHRLLTNARDAYLAMFIETGVGPGTSPMATGMHITWVSKGDFLLKPKYYETYIFPTSGPYPLMGAPNYSRFLMSYYYTSTPTTNLGSSVCLASSKSSRDPTTSTELLIDPKIVFIDNVVTEIRSEITRNVDFVFVETGFDVTHLLQNNIVVRRRLDESARRQLDAVEGAESPSFSFARRREDVKWRYLERDDRRRRLQDGFGTGDHFFIFGGDVAVQYNGSKVVASWDSAFYWIQSGNDVEPLYAFDDGGGLKSIPVCYFDENSPISSEQIAIGITVDEAIANLGCELGSLSFSFAKGQFTLYVYRGTTLSAVPEATGRKFVPISYIEYSVGNVFVGELLGGFTSIVVPWTPDSTFTVFSRTDLENLKLFGSDTAFMNIIAYDEDAKITDFEIFPYSYVNSAGSQNRRELVVVNEKLFSPPSN